MPTNIPHARQIIAEIAHELDADNTKKGARRAKILRDLLPIMTRQSRRRAACATARPITPKLKREIRAYAKRYPSTPYRAVGAHFGVDGGRISEVMTGVR